MKKIMLTIALLLLLLTSGGCKKEEVQQIPQINKETTTIVRNDEKSDATTVQNLGKAEYVDKSQALDTTDYQAATGTEILDEALMAEIQTVVEKFYYNFFFSPNTENGQITEDDMLLFAISYIYQYEYNELRFDSDTFILYIPEENVASVIRRFFGYDFTNHRYPALDKVTYEDGFYLVPAQDDNFGEKPTVVKVLQIAENSYKVFIKDPQEINYEVVLEKQEDRLVMRNYKKIENKPAQ